MAKRKSERTNAPGSGSRVTNELKAKFRTAYLRLGSVSAAAAAVKIPRTTCIPIADEAEADPVFVKARQDYLAHGLPRVEAMLIRSCEIAAKRVKKKPTVTKMGEFDNGHHYLRALSDAHRSLATRRKIDHDIAPENKPAWPSGVRIIIDGVPEPEPEPDK
jgi:hypothetical protein